MVKRMPTQLGDVLVLSTDQSFRVHAVGRVSNDGQQDFRAPMNVTYVSDQPAAMAKAKALVLPGRRIFLQNIDTGHWSEISDLHQPSRSRSVGSAVSGLTELRDHPMLS
jgi:hypothetical protein